MVNGGDVLVDWSEKNVIVKAPESNPTTGALKRPHGKSPSSKDKPKKLRRQKAGVEKSKAGSPKPQWLLNPALVLLRLLSSVPQLMPLLARYHQRSIIEGKPVLVGYISSKFQKRYLFEALIFLQSFYSSSLFLFFFAFILWR